jgi:electron transfer flavoprotein alpha subunit
VKRESGRPELTEASIVDSASPGVASAGNLAIIEDPAHSLGVAVGISDAIQHRAGMPASRSTVAINKGSRGPDPRAGRLRCHRRSEHGVLQATEQITARSS